MDVRNRYLRFAETEARGSSPTDERLARAAAASPTMIDRLEQLPPVKRQPNLLFAAARFAGVSVDDSRRFLGHVASEWEASVCGHANESDPDQRGGSHGHDPADHLPDRGTARHDRGGMFGRVVETSRWASRPRTAADLFRLRSVSSGRSQEPIASAGRTVNVRRGRRPRREGGVWVSESPGERHVVVAAAVVEGDPGRQSKTLA